MQQPFKMLVITDHRGHSTENSLYALVQAMRLHPLCTQLDIVTKGNILNEYFFKEVHNDYIYAAKVGADFRFQKDGTSYVHQLRKTPFSAYDVVWLRLPPPLSDSFLRFLDRQFARKLIINDPMGIYEAGSKAYLMKFKEFCPPMSLCNSLADIDAFRKRFSIVLKPYRNYGGKGIIKIKNDIVWIGNEQISFSDFAKKNENKRLEYVGVKYLEKVSEGDKRIIVVNGKILGASLRLPAKGSWLCNVAMGGSSKPSKVDKYEQEMIAVIDPILTKKGIVMYGVDTLTGDDGKRKLSEINTTSIGGIPQMAKQSGKPVVKWAINGIVDYIQKNINKTCYFR